LISVALLDYDYLITKKKLEENDNVEDFVTPVTEFREEALADRDVGALMQGTIIQFERKGYFIFDGVVRNKLEFIKIPDGRAASLASKAGISAALPATAGDKSKGLEDNAKVKSTGNSEALATRMYQVEKVYGEDVRPEVDTKMYQVDSVYDS
jgi:glutamyl-tRNA synthetase